MKKNLLWMLAAILFCGAMTTSCGSDDDDNGSSSSDTKIVGMRIAYVVEFLDGYDTLTDYTVTVTWTDENGKNITENITKDFVKDVKLLATKGTEGIFTVKMTPTNSAKEEHDLGLNIGLLAKPMAANGNVSDNGIVSVSHPYKSKGKSGSAYREVSNTTKFHLVDNMVKQIY